MKKLLSKVFLIFIVMIIPHIAMGKGKIGVIDFKAGVGIMQSDVDGISAIFTTYFSPQDYILVERTQIEQIILEQGFQRTKLTQKQMVKIGEILNLQYIVVGDINVVAGIYNLDVRVVGVQDGNIVAKDGASWEKGVSYRMLMKEVATRLAENMPLVEEKPIVIPVDTVVVKKEKKQRKQLKPISSGYEQSIECTFNCTSVGIGAGINYIGGYRFNNTLFGGVGIGLNFRDGLGINRLNHRYDFYNAIGDDTRFSIPLYMHLRTYFTKTRFQPFFALSIGVQYSDLEPLEIDYAPFYGFEHKCNPWGFIINPAAGFNCRVSDNVGVYLKVSYNAETHPYIQSENELVNEKIVAKHKICHGFNIGLGLTF